MGADNLSTLSYTDQVLSHVENVWSFGKDQLYYLTESSCHLTKKIIGNLWGCGTSSVPSAVDKDKDPLSRTLDGVRKTTTNAIGETKKILHNGVQKGVDSAASVRSGHFKLSPEKSKTASPLNAEKGTIERLKNCCYLNRTNAVKGIGVVVIAFLAVQATVIVYKLKKKHDKKNQESAPRKPSY